jgi:hypothetical protein
MKKPIIYYILLFALTLTFTSCKKDDDCQENDNPTPNTTPTKTDLLTGNYWKITAHTMSPGYDFLGNGELITDIYAYNASFPENQCFMDNLLKFNTDYNVLSDAGAILCEPGETQTRIIGYWAWNSNQSILTFGESSYELVELNTNTLKLKKVYEYYNNEGTALVTYTEIFTYSKG